MTIKPFAIQGADLTLGGVNLQAGATTIVIPGVTQAANYFVEEVDEYGSDDNQDLGSQEGAITIIDNAEYVYRSGGAQPSGAYVPAEYSVDELDDGNIEEVQVEVDGTFAAADKTRAEASNMWATLTPTPFVSFDPLNWQQIPFRPKMRAGEVTNVGGGSGGVVERSIEFPAGEEGDTSGTLALNPMGSLFICTADWTDVDDVNKTFVGEAVRDYSAGQSGFVYNFIELLVADHPGLQAIINTLNAAGVNYQTDFTVDGGSNFGGAQTISQIGFGNNNTEIVIGWPHRTGVDPTTIDQGDEFTVIYTGTVPQPAIWQQVNTGNPLGDLTIEFGNQITNGDGDVQLSADEDILIEAGDDIRLDADDEVSIRTYGTGSGNYVEVVTGYDSNNQHQWKFDTSGNLTLPAGGDIVDSTGASVLGGGGAGGDANIWVETFASDAPATDQVQIATSVEYDADGNIFALFHHYVNIPPDASETYTSVAKLSPTGAVLWQVRFNANINTDGWGLAYDGSDTVYVAGSTDGTPLTYQFATLTKIDAFDGTIVWNKTYDFEADSQSAVVDVDSNLNPIMVGYAYNGTDNYIITTKVDAADGSVIWSRTLDGQNDDEAYGMAVGPTNEVVTIGNIGQLGTGVTDGAATLYTDPASNVNWTTGVNISGAGISCDVTFTDGVPTFTNIVDTVGNRTVDGTVATISGVSFGGTSPADDMILKVGTLAVNDTYDRMVVIKYSAGGTIAWQKAVLFDEGYSCSGADADIDADGNIYVCGSYNTPIGSAMSLVKFDSSGVKQWSRRVVGDCADFATSVVVGPDNNLYLSGITSSPNAETITWVVAKYSITGSVVWQRLIENTASWTFTGGLFFGNSGGSNIAVGTDYVALAGGFGNLGNGEDPTATVLQIDTNGTPFAIGDWAVTTAQFPGNLDNTASDILVVNAGKTTGTVTPAVAEFVVEEGGTNFLVGTLYTAPGGADSLVNGVYSVILGNTGTVTLPAGGTITEGYVTSNPTIQLTPANPDVASQKLVIKGGSNYDFTDNGITLSYQENTAIVGATLEFYVNGATAYANQTLYWWIYPESAGIATPSSGTVALNEFGGGGPISFVLDSDDYEFTVRVSPENNNYDPANTGVESGLINAAAPTFDADHHLHLTTGNLAETSIFLGTDNHNVRTTVDGGIEINTYLYPSGGGSGKWTFDESGRLTLPDPGIVKTGADTAQVGSSLVIATGSAYGDTAVSIASNTSLVSTYLPGGTITFQDGDVRTITQIDDYPGGTDIFWTTAKTGTLFPITLKTANYAAATTSPEWEFGTDGSLTFPDATVQTTAWTGTAADLVSITTASITTASNPNNGPFGGMVSANLEGDGIVVFGPAGGTSEPDELAGVDLTRLVGGTITQDGGGYSSPILSVTSLGNKLYSIQVEGLLAAATGGEGIGLTITVDPLSEKIWTFGTDGTITFPDGTTNSGDTVISTSTYNIQSIGNTLIQTSANAGAKTWTFGTDGTTTLPGAVVKSTVAKTGVILPTITGIAESLTHNSGLTGLTDAQYGPFTLGTVTFSVAVNGGVINNFVSVSSTANVTINDVLGTIDSGDIGGTAGALTITVTVNGVVQATPTALDLTKTVNVIGTNHYGLADGVEGQIMYFVPSSTHGNTSDAYILVSNARTVITGVGMSNITDYSWTPFTGESLEPTTIAMAIFADGAWCLRGGASN